MVVIVPVVAPLSGSLSFAVNHTLGAVPVAAVVMITSLGKIVFQKPVKFDGAKLYLTASDYSDVSADILLWS